jgi:hypothetical protein
MVYAGDPHLSPDNKKVDRRPSYCQEGLRDDATWHEVLEPGLVLVDWGQLM